MYGIFLLFVVVADVVTIVRVILARKGDQQMYEAPEYRQYWVGPASNPYQAYGGYQAPSYGNYSYPPRYQQGQGQGAAPTGMSQQQPQSTGFTAQQGAGYAAAQQGTGYVAQQQGAGYAAAQQGTGYAGQQQAGYGQQQGAGYAAQQGTGYAGQQQQGTGYASQQQQGATYNGQQQTGYAGQQQATDYIPRADQGQQAQNPFMPRPRGNNRQQGSNSGGGQQPRR